MQKRRLKTLGKQKTEETVEVVFELPGPLGIAFVEQPGQGNSRIIVVRELIPGSASASNKALLRPGMVLLAVQGEDVRTSSLHSAMEVIKRSKRPLTLELSTHLVDPEDATQFLGMFRFTCLAARFSFPSCLMCVVLFGYVVPFLAQATTLKNKQMRTLR